MTSRTRARATAGLPAVGALLLISLLLLSGCGYGEALDKTRGFEYATDKVNTLSNGVSDRSASVAVLGAVVVAGEDNAGVFAASLVNSTRDPVALSSLAGGALGSLTTEESAPITVNGDGVVNMFADGGIPVTGTFEAGNFVDVALTFDSGETVNMQVPVIKPCYHYSPDVLAAGFPKPSTAEHSDYACESSSPEFGGGSHGE